MTRRELLLSHGASCRQCRCSINPAAPRCRGRWRCARPTASSSTSAAIRADQGLARRWRPAGDDYAGRQPGDHHPRAPARERRQDIFIRSGTGEATLDDRARRAQGRVHPVRAPGDVARRQKHRRGHASMGRDLFTSGFEDISRHRPLVSGCGARQLSPEEREQRDRRYGIRYR